MTHSTQITLHIGNAIPPGGDAYSRQVLALWQSIAGFFEGRVFQSQSAIAGPTRRYHISLDASALVERLQQAINQSGSFSAQHRARVDRAEVAVDAHLLLTIAADTAAPGDDEAYLVASVFLQQLLLAAHLTLPGAAHWLDTRFVGSGAHRYEAQAFDAHILQGAQAIAADNDWPHFQAHRFDTVWAWLEQCGVSCSHTAISDINKVLFTLLKIAQQRHEHSARTALLVQYALEVLVDCRHTRLPALIAERIRLVLGPIPEAANRLVELHESCNKLFVANRPVHRPPLICHNTASILREQLGQSRSAVEAGVAMILALLQDLIAHNAERFVFSTAVDRR